MAIGFDIHPIVDAGIIGGSVFGLLYFFLGVCKKSIDPRTGKAYWYSKPWVLGLLATVGVFIINWFIGNAEYKAQYSSLGL